MVYRGLALAGIASAFASCTALFPGGGSAPIDAGTAFDAAVMILPPPMTACVPVERLRALRCIVLRRLRHHDDDAEHGRRHRGARLFQSDDDDDDLPAVTRAAIS